MDEDKWPGDRAFRFETPNETLYINVKLMK